MSLKPQRFDFSPSERFSTIFQVRSIHKNSCSEFKVITRKLPKVHFFRYCCREFVLKLLAYVCIFPQLGIVNGYLFLRSDLKNGTTQLSCFAGYRSYTMALLGESWTRKYSWVQRTISAWSTWWTIRSTLGPEVQSRFLLDSLWRDDHGECQITTSGGG